MQALLIINPCSGKLKIQPHLLNVISTLNSAGFQTRVEVTQYHNHAMEIAANCKEDLIICSGGDGTLNQVISGIIKANKDIPIGYIPAGSTNDFANTLGISLDILTATKNITKRNVFPVDIGLLRDNNATLEKNNYFTYIASFGLFTSVSYNTPQQVKNTFGHLAYVFEGMKDLRNIKTYNVSVKTDDKEFSGEYIFGAILNTTSIGGVVQIDNIVDMSDGIFELVLVKEPKNITDLGEIYDGIANSNFTGNMFDFIKTTKLSLKFEEYITWSLDGERKDTSNSVYIENLNRRINIYK